MDDEQKPGGCNVGLSDGWAWIPRMKELENAIALAKEYSPKEGPLAIVTLRLDQAEHLLANVKAVIDAVGWYAAHADLMRKYTLHGNTKAMLEIMKTLAVDGGKRARECVPPNAPDNRPFAPGGS